MKAKPKTLFEKIWERHVVTHQPGAPAILYIDLHLVHEVTSPQAFSGLKQRGLTVRRPDRTVATVDHGVPTLTPAPGDPLGRLSAADEMSRAQIHQLEGNCREFNIPCYGIESQDQGIVHVIGPELGLTQPGMTIVCGDSHTATHGAFGALAFGIGTSEVEHVLASQCLLQHPPRTMQVQFEGEAQKGVSAKDFILALIQQIGVGGGTGHVIEYTGEAIRKLDMESRMTICNMSIECGARAGMVAPDETTFKYLAGRRFAPQGAAWESAIRNWRELASDPGAVYDRQVTVDVSRLAPMITFGTNPGMGMPVDGRIPDPQTMEDPSQRQALEKALAYMGLTPGQLLLDHPVDVVFIGSCTNGRLNDLRQAAQIFKCRSVAKGVRVLVVPGSQAVKRAAEAEGLDQIFKHAGAEWREPGCSMCIAMNGDQIAPGQVAVSTSNRNFEGRQGKGGRTLLASPWTAAATAVTGRVSDARQLMV
jgi:3-isopropylmalate/(R)-2-methylmalate dehydratase large subunit